LRGLFKYCLGQVRESFEDLYSIESRELFPRALLVDDIWSSLNFMHKEQLTGEHFYKTAPDYKKMDDPNIKKNLARSSSIEQVGEDCEQVENLTLTEFSKKLEALEIIVDIDTTSRLFNALTLGKNSTLSCVSFQIFVDTYQAKEDELQKVNQRYIIALKPHIFSIHAGRYNMCNNDYKN
jgi:hypothetical protein